MKRSIILLILLILVAGQAAAQKVKAKEVKKALEAGKVSTIELVADSTFTPGFRKEFDLRVQLDGGQTVLASDFHFIWDQALIQVDHAQHKIKGEFLANGMGVIIPGDASQFYPYRTVRVTADLAGKKVEREMKPTFCFNSLRIERTGQQGSSGDRGSSSFSGGGSGGNGEQGSDGTNGPDIQVEFLEESFNGKNHLMILVDGKKYPVDTDCSMIVIASRGGDGGKGGRGGNGGNSSKNSKGEYTSSGGRGGNGGKGGDGGNGGNITVTGSQVYEKYKSKITITSEGGDGGDGSDGGNGGDGKSNGRSGSMGYSGSKGQHGTVTFKES